MVLKPDEKISWKKCIFLRKYLQDIENCTTFAVYYYSSTPIQQKYKGSPLPSSPREGEHRNNNN